MSEPAQSRRRSYSQLTSYAECSYRYYLQRVRRVPAKQAAWFPGGTAFHSTTEWLDREYYFRNTTTLDAAGRRKLAEVWTEKLDQAVEDARQREPDTTKWRTAGRPSAEKPNGEDVDWWRTAGLNMVMGYAKWWSTTNDQWHIWALPDGEPALEVPLLAPFGRVPVVGYVDQVLQHNVTGRLLVVDKKTGSRTPMFPLQLAIYGQALTAVTGREFAWGSYYMARPADLTPPESLARWTPELLGELYEHMDEAETRGLYLPNLGSHCSRCLVKDWCPPAGGRAYEESA